MYSGFGMTKYSGRAMGAHQQIDRLARRRLAEVLGEDDSKFPSFNQIIRFEGKNGPDGIKIKSPGKDEPWHYLSPLDDDNKAFNDIITTHYQSLVLNLKKKNTERAAFEAAWLAHAIVDGMTPAHHYPYEAAIAELRGGKGLDSRTTKREKLLFKGETPLRTATNMYKVYGPKGLYTSHHLFEFGIMLLLRPMRLKEARPSAKDIKDAISLGPEKFFMRSAREVAVLDLYEQYLQKGWTSSLTNKVRHKLAPTIVKTVCLLWYSAYMESKK